MPITADVSLRYESVEPFVAFLEATAVARDRDGGTPLRERAELRTTGLLALGIPRAFGGLGASRAEVLAVTRRFARVDPSLAHVFAFHHLMLETLRLFGGDVVHRDAAIATVREGWFWGNALNPKDPRTTIVRRDSGSILDGVKGFASGASDSDRLVVSAREVGTDRLVIAAIPTRREGIAIDADWDAIGQRQTDSGTVRFDRVAVHDHELLTTPGPLGSVEATLRPSLAQAILANVYLGVAEGALDAARGASTAAPNDLRADLRRLRAGELHVLVASAAALTEAAGVALDEAFDRGADLTADERGAVAVAIATAKVTAARASLEAGTVLFDLLGARATGRTLGLDRFWRNARTHTLHDPIDVKLVELGAFALEGTIPTPSFYS